MWLISIIHICSFIIMKKISIIVPTYKEAENIPVLCSSIHKIISKNYKYEIIIVDDNSQDGTDKAVAALKKKKINVTLKVRTKEKGLSSAVIAGFEMACGDVFVCMDSDLSHPVEAIPEMVEKIFEDGADFVIGSRNIPGGSADSFNIYRKLNAFIARMAALPFAKISDPMAGFFCFPRKIYTKKVRSELSPIGWKICLEILIKANPSKIAEVPIKFEERLYGESKLSIKEQLNYIKHLRRLFIYKYRTLSEFITYGFIGGIGAIIDLTIVSISYNLLAFRVHIHHTFAYGSAWIIGFVVAGTSILFLNKYFNCNKAKKKTISGQYTLFVLTFILGFSINYLVSMLLFINVSFFHYHYILTTIIGILTGVLINFTGCKSIVFKNCK